MDTENVLDKTNEAREALPAASQSVQPHERKPSSWFSELSKYIVLGGFVFYVFGFVIWHSHLSQYGVNTPSLWKIEFFSASLCYFMVVVSISFPAAFLFARATSARVETAFIKANGVSVYPLLFLYAFLLSQVSFLFFGTSIYLNTGALGVILVILSLLQVSWALFLRVRELVKKPIGSRLGKLLGHHLWFAGFALALSLTALIRSERVDGFFFFSTFMLYPSLTFLGGFQVELYWRGFSPPLKMLALVCAGFVLISHARMFGNRQFGRIPQAVGGGQPLKALLVFGPEQRNLTSLLSIPQFNQTNSNPTPTVSTNSGPTTNTSTSVSTTNVSTLTSMVQPVAQTQAFYGPVSILMKSEREIVFFVPTVNSKTNLLPHAKMIRSEQVQAIEFLNSR